MYFLLRSQLREGERDREREREREREKEREIVVLQLLWCKDVVVFDLYLFLIVPRVGLLYVIEPPPGHTYSIWT